jgi:hypothetical protein
MARRWLLGPIALLVVTVAGPARAEVVTFDIVGTVSSFSNPDGLLNPGDVTVGAPIAIKLAYDTSSTPVSSTSTEAVYRPLSFQFTFSTGAVSFDTGPLIFSSVTVQNDGVSGDVFQAQTSTGGFPYVNRISLELDDPGATVFSDTSLPNQLDPSQFSGLKIEADLSDTELTAQILGEVTSITKETLTPEPASIALLGFGALGLVGYGWRKRRQWQP